MHSSASRIGLSGFEGFDRAHLLLVEHEARVNARGWLMATSILSDQEVMAVHVDAWSRVDRIYLTTFDHQGAKLRCETVHNDWGQGFPMIPEFDWENLHGSVPECSDLAAVAPEGWIIDLAPVRSFCIEADRKSTQREVFLAHLRDLVHRGDVVSPMFPTVEGGGTESA